MDFRELRRRARGRKAADPETADDAVEETTAADADDADEDLLSGEGLDEAVAAADGDEPTADDAPADDAGADDETDDDDLDSDDEEYEELVEIMRFRLHREYFALLLDEIEEIIKPKDYTWVPRTPDWILGIVSLRGTMVPVVDLRRRLGIPASEHASQRIVVVTYDDELCGLLVDEVRNVEMIHPDRIEALPAALTEAAGKYLSGLVRIQNELIALVDLETVLQWEGLGGERAA